MHQNYYLSVGAIMAMVGMNDDAQASSSKYLPCKRNLRPGLGGQIVENPRAQKESDELAGKFRSGKTYLLTDLRYKCTSNQGGMTDIQYGLDELGDIVVVIDINSLEADSKPQKFFAAVEHLKGLMEAAQHEDNVTCHIRVSFAFMISEHPPYNVWVERDYVEQFTNAIREVDKRATRPIFVVVQGRLIPRDRDGHL